VGADAFSFSDLLFVLFEASVRKYVRSCAVSASAIFGATRFHIQIAAAAASCRPFVICYQNSPSQPVPLYTHTHTSSQQIAQNSVLLATSPEKVKLKGKLHSRRGLEGPEGE